MSGPNIFVKSSIRICTKAETWKIAEFCFCFFGKWEPLCCSSGPSCKPGLNSRGCLVPRRLRDWTRSSCSPEISLSMFLWLDGYIFQSTLVIVIHQSNFSCATHVIKESPSHRPLPSSDLEEIELLPILEAEHTPELHNGASKISWNIEAVTEKMPPKYIQPTIAKGPRQDYMQLCFQNI